MKKTIIIIIIILISFFEKSLMSQSCLPEGIIFNTQDQIDNFQVNYPNCTKIEGNVTIQGYISITNLIGLNMLTSIG